MTLRRLLIISLIGIHPAAFAAENSSLRDNWLELSSRVNTGYTKALRCELGVRKSDRSMCADFSAYMKLFYPRIAFLNASISGLTPQQLQKVAAPRDYDDYTTKFNKIAEVSSAWGE